MGVEIMRIQTATQDYWVAAKTTELPPRRPKLLHCWICFDVTVEQIVAHWNAYGNCEGLSYSNTKTRKMYDGDSDE